MMKQLRIVHFHLFVWAVAGAHLLSTMVPGPNFMVGKLGLLLRSRSRRLLKRMWMMFTNLLPKKWHVRIDHLRIHGTLPNLEHPRTFSEKITYRKLYDLDPRMPKLIDKIAAKEEMAARFGPGFVIPALATFKSEDEVDFTALPYPCVLKASHGSGMNVFLIERPPNEKKIRRQLHRFLRGNHYTPAEEWAYSQVEPRLLVEPMIEGGDHGLIDYKFHTFDGRVFAIQVDIDRFTDHRRCFFDPNWERMPFSLFYPETHEDIAPPRDLKAMLHYAEQIGEGFSYVRVDLYEVDGGCKFGEATFYPGAGLEPFNPPEFDEIFGQQWQRL
jgi:hypothetical protein